MKKIINKYNNVPNTFKIITIENPNIKISMEPIEVCDIEDSNGVYEDYKRVVIYKFVHIDNKTGTIIEQGTIPYYISDGYTNRFRSNSLLPFMCFSNADDINCPNLNMYKTRGILIKHNFFKTIDTGVLEKKINTEVNTLNPTKYTLSNIIDMIRQDNIYIKLKNLDNANVNSVIKYQMSKGSSEEDIIELPRNICDSDNLGIMYYLSRGLSHDVVSILPRIDSLPNYLLFVLSDSFDIRHNYNELNYFPSGIDFGDSDNYNKYNMEFRKNTNSDIDKFRKLYIKTLVSNLIEQKQHLESVLSIVNKPFENIEKHNYLTFNEKIKSCDNDMKSIIKIISKMTDIFKNKIEMSQESSAKQLLLNMIVKDYKNSSYLVELENYNAFILKNWKTSCKNIDIQEALNNPPDFYDSMILERFQNKLLDINRQIGEINNIKEQQIELFRRNMAQKQKEDEIELLKINESDILEKEKLLKTLEELNIKLSNDNSDKIRLDIDNIKLKIKQLEERNLEVERIFKEIHKYDYNGIEDIKKLFDFEKEFLITQRDKLKLIVDRLLVMKRTLEQEVLIREQRNNAIYEIISKDSEVLSALDNLKKTYDSLKEIIGINVSTKIETLLNIFSKKMTIVDTRILFQGIQKDLEPIKSKDINIEKLSQEVEDFAVKVIRKHISSKKEIEQKGYYNKYLKYKSKYLLLKKHN